MQELLYVNIYGIQENMMSAINQEYFFLGETLNDPYNIGKNYGALDIVQMLYDIQAYQIYEEPFDPNSIYSAGVNKDNIVKAQLINLIAPEGLRGLAYEDIGDYVSLCLKDWNNKAVYGEVTIDSLICNLKLRARIVATARKFPGFHTFSGYQHI